jgi:serine/threonine-protein kinase
MDFVDGPDLRQVVERARSEGHQLEVVAVLEWASQLLDVVEYLHRQVPPVVHRDIKPSNIKLVDGNRIKLVDFGLVKPLDPQDPRTLTAARGVGSLPYTPLEQYAGDTGVTGVTADIYAIGATLYHLLTGRSPATAQERFLMPNALERPRRVNPLVSSRVEAAVLQAMALHPSRRMSSVGELRESLLGSGPEAADPDDWPPHDQWRDALWENLPLFALAALLLLLAVLATWQARP